MGDIKEFPMITNKIEKLSDLFKILGDQGRLQIIYVLNNREMSVSQLSEELDTSPSAISHQLKILKMSNVVKRRKEGKYVYYSLSDSHVRELFEIGIEHVCE